MTPWPARTLQFTLLGAVCLLAARPAHANPTREEKRRGMIKLREILKGEPAIREVQDAALRHYQLEPSRIRSLMTAARAKGLLPEIDAGVDNTLGHNYSILNNALYGNFPNGYYEQNLASSDQLVYHVRGVWDLSRLAFNPEQLDIASLNSLGETLVREVTTLYFSRRRLLASLILSPPDDEEELFLEQQRVQELTATIDAFTGGTFAAKAWKASADDQ